MLPPLPSRALPQRCPAHTRRQSRLEREALGRGLRWRDLRLTAELAEAKLGAAAVGAFRVRLEDHAVLVAHLARDAIVDIAPSANPFIGFRHPIASESSSSGRTVTFTVSTSGLSTGNGWSKTCSRVNAPFALYKC